MALQTLEMLIVSAVLLLNAAMITSADEAIKSRRRGPAD